MYQAECKETPLGTYDHWVLASVGLEETWIQIFPCLVQTGTWYRLPHCGFRLNFWLLVSESLFHSLFLKMCKVYFSCHASGRERVLKIFFFINYISKNVFYSVLVKSHLLYIDDKMVFAMIITIVIAVACFF